MRALRIGCAVFLLPGAGGTRADAQAIATSFDQLAVLVKPGDKVSVVDASGREAKGRIGTLSRDAMILVTEAGPRQLREGDVATIRQRRGDSLLNGAIIGAAAGTAYFVTLSMHLWDSDGGDVIVPTLVAGGVIFAGLGAGAGVGLDALITRRQVIYQKPAGASRVSVVPLVGPGRRGAAVSVKF